MANNFQFLHVNRADPAKKDAETRKKEYREIYAPFDANKAAVKFYGFSKTELLQKTINDIHTLPPEELNKLMDEAIKNDSNFFEFRHKVANGAIKDVEIYASPFQFASEEVGERGIG